MDIETAVARIQQAASSSSSSPTPPADTTTSANDAALALAWIQGQASSGAVSARAVSRLAPALAALVAGGGAAASSSAVRANAAGAAAALAATADPDGDSGALALDAAVSAPLAQMITDAACAEEPSSSSQNRALLINSLAALGALVPLGGAGGEACRACLASTDVLLAIALGAGSATKEDDNDSAPDLEVREAAVDVLCAVAAAAGSGSGGSNNTTKAALVAAGAPAVAARVLILAGSVAEKESEAKPGLGETAATELRMRCLLLLGMLCGGGGGGGDEEAATAATSALRQLAQEPGAIVGLLAAVRLGSSDHPAANVARSLLAGMRRDDELAPLVEEAVQGAVEAAKAAGA